MSALEAIKYSDGRLQLLDQRLLPLETVYLDVPDPQAAWQQIKVCACASNRHPPSRRVPLGDAAAAGVRAPHTHNQTLQLAHWRACAPPPPPNNTIKPPHAAINAGHGGARRAGNRGDRCAGAGGAPDQRRARQAACQRGGVPA